MLAAVLKPPKRARHMLAVLKHPKKARHMPVGTTCLCCPTVGTVVEKLVEACQEFTEFTSQDPCPEKDLWILQQSGYCNKQMTPAKMS